MPVVMNKHKEGDKEKGAGGLFIPAFLLEKVPAESWASLNNGDNQCLTWKEFRFLLRNICSDNQKSAVTEDTCV